MRRLLPFLYLAVFFSFILQLNDSLLIGKPREVNISSDKNKRAQINKENKQFDISYSVEPFYDINTFRLIVVLEFQGEKSGETKLLLPTGSSAGVDNTSIKFLKAISANTTIEDTDRPEIKTVKYYSNTLVRIYYQFEESSLGDVGSSNYYLPVIRKNYFHFFGDTFFIIPKWDWSNVYDYKISWNHFPSGWNLANSFGINQTYQAFNSALWKFRNAVFAGGDFKIYNRATQAGQLYIAARGNWTFSVDQLCDVTKTIISTENNFWNDSSNPFEVVIVLPFDSPDSPIAEDRTNALALYLSPRSQIDFDLKKTIAHEYFHNWIGDAIQFADPPQLVYWFKEGVCEYYARLLLLRARLINLEEYVSRYNEMLNDYYTSSVRFETNEKATKEFWTDLELNKLTLQRGDILLNNLNAAIMKNSNGVKSLDDFIRDLYKRCRTESLVISNGSLSALIRFYAGEATLADIMRTLNSGILPKANINALGPCFYPETINKKRFWLFGEEYEIPFYKPKNGSLPLDNNCMWWFGAD